MSNNNQIIISAIILALLLGGLGFIASKTQPLQIKKTTTSSQVVLIDTVTNTQQFLVAGAVGSDALEQIIKARTFDQPNTTKLQALVPNVTDTDLIYGNKNAETMIIEYSDIDCPFCKQVHPNIKQVVDQSNGTVAWVYRHLPLDMHPFAKPKAIAVECIKTLAGNDSAFTSIGLFMAQSEASNSKSIDSDIAEVAKQSGITDTAKFESCLATTTIADKVTTDTDSGNTAGITGTPGLVIVQKI
mgnify:CR=1 FL=1